jgi:hypothetical protein
MPRTPAPLTVEHTGWQYGPRLWVVKDATGNVIITAKEEGDARAFVALPALEKALKHVTERYVALIESGDCGNWDPETEPEIIEARAALAQADGPKEQP